jgi:hypothetical protein
MRLPLVFSTIYNSEAFIACLKKAGFFILCFILVGFLHAEDFRLENSYLLWTTKKSSSLPPLVTSASLNDPLPGAVGQPGTKVLLGNEKVDSRWRHGYQVSLGKCFSCLEGEINFLTLPKTSRHSSHTSGEPGSLDLAVPIFDVTGLWGLNGVPGETVFILPGPIDGPGFKGKFSLKVTSHLLGSEVNIKKSFRSIDGLIGFRWLHLQETLSFSGRTSALPDSMESGFYNFKDSFKATNNFYGPQIGINCDYHLQKWSLKSFVKLAVGVCSQKETIKGKSQTSNGNLFYMTNNTGNQVLNGGVFAEPTNQGTHHHHPLAILLETGAKIAYHFTPCLDLSVGYNFLWLNKVVRPEKMIDRKINPTQTALAEASRESVGVGPVVPIQFGEAKPASLPVGEKRPKAKHHIQIFGLKALHFP